MRQKTFITMDGNEAAASVAYRVSEVACIYPITPSSPMGEWADQWSSEKKPNIWGTIPVVVEMQSEAGAAGAVHGSLQAGALTTTFTASQGLLLKIPNMYKIAGELTPAVFHITARSLAMQALSIFGDHSDIMETRATGFALLGSTSVQEAMDLALIAHAATLRSRIPFLHFFDGFRTSHELSKVETLADEDLRAMIPDELIAANRARSMSPDRPLLRGTAQNPDVYFQCRETVTPYYAACPGIVQKVMDEFAKLIGRSYHLFDYVGDPNAERVVILMGSGCETAHETVEYLNNKGEKVGVLKVRLYRPFDVKSFVEALPATVKSIAVLDRTKEAGSIGDPLYLDCIAAIHEGMNSGWAKFKTTPVIVGGRYGLSSKEFTAAMVKAIFDNLQQKQPQNHFTIGINDDVSHTSLPFDPEYSIEPDSVFRGMFYGLGADGTVGANKNSIKIIGETTDNYCQGYFVYDSKKAGAVTVSHLRFGPNPIRSTYLVNKAKFVACHQPVFIERYDMLQNLIPGGTFLYNTPYNAEEVWQHLPKHMQKQMIDKKLKFYVIDAYQVARDSGMKKEINTIMQTCFFAISGILPKEQAIEEIKTAIKKTYGKKGQQIVDMNYKAVDESLKHLHEVKIPATVTSTIEMHAPFSDKAPEFVRKVLGEIYANRGEQIPVGAFSCDGTFPTATAQWEKRNIALQIPVWDPAVCIQCARCAFICPHACIRIKVYDPKYLQKAPATFKSLDTKEADWKGTKFTVQVAPEDCTECGLCVESCMGKNKEVAGRKALYMMPQPPLREQERQNWNFFMSIPDVDRKKIKVSSIRQQQFERPLFEFSGACAGCGETPYLKLLSQLFGDRMLVANATGCSSIYGGNLPTTPWSQNADGRGPAWSNSLFEDAAEFGLGFRVSVDKQTEYARELLQRLAVPLGDDVVKAILTMPQKSEADIAEQRERVAILKKKLAVTNGQYGQDAKSLLAIADMLVRKSVWSIGGDGWAYDIGFGGLDHVIASGRNINLLVLDTEVYSNTGGQMSKATPRGAVARFAAGGKRNGKKDLGLIAMSYGNVYVATVAMGAKDEHTLKAFLEAEAYEGPSIIIAYCHCIAHGINMSLEHQKAAVNSGQWLLYRYNPARTQQGENPLILDSPEPKIPVSQYMDAQNRFKMLQKSDPEAAHQLAQEAQEDINTRYALYRYLAERKMTPAKTEAPKS